MKLVTKSIRQRLLSNGIAQAHVRGTPDAYDFAPVCRLFNPVGAGTWLLTELDPKDPDVAWGLCDLGMGTPEFGTVSLREIADFRHPVLGLGIERDLYWRAKAPISAYIAAAATAGRIVEPGGARPRGRGHEGKGATKTQGERKAPAPLRQSEQEQSQ